LKRNELLSICYLNFQRLKFFVYIGLCLFLLFALFVSIKNVLTLEVNNCTYYTIMVCTPKSEVLPNLSIILPPQKTKFGIYYSYIYLQIFFLLHQFILNVLSVSSSYLISIDPKIMSFIVFTS